MNLNKSKRKDGRVYLSIEKRYWDKELKKSRNKTVKSIGYVDALEKVYPDPIAHFTEIVQKMTDDENKRKTMVLELNADDILPECTSNRKNFGYCAIVKLFHELGVHDFLKQKAIGASFKYNTGSIMLLLVISRLLFPGSKKKAFEERVRYFERFNFSLDDVYRSLTHFSDIGISLQRYMHKRISSIYGNNTQTVYYDVTNYYFETDVPDDFRMFGYSKENRKSPIVQMGLAMDKEGIPLHYELFPGNMHDSETFRTVIGEVRRNYDTGRIVVVADKGVISGNNIMYLKGGDREKSLNGYVMSISIRGNTDEFKRYVVEPTGYVDVKGKPAREDTDFMSKSRHYARDIRVRLTSGRTVKKIVYEKQVIFWGRAYAEKAKHERDEVLKKTYRLVKEPSAYNKATSYGAAKYAKHIEFDKKGNIIKSNKKPVIDFEKIREEEMYDGYYAIVTSELDMSENRIIDTYKGIWEIEETFKITKSEIETRPVYLSNKEHINGHFLSCFIALIIIRLLQKKTDKKYSAEIITDCLRQISCSNEYENIYLFDYRSQVSDAIGDAVGIDFTKKRLRLGEIKKILAQAKK
jgi:transposase